MSYKPQSICNWPGCNTLILVKPGEPQRCKAHPVLDKYERKDNRPSAGKRGYDNDWRKARDYYIRKHPLCEMQKVCEGAPSVDVDHKKPISIAPELRLNEDNLQALCRACHNYKTKHIDPKVISEHEQRQSAKLRDADSGESGDPVFR